MMCAFVAFLAAVTKYLMKAIQGGCEFAARGYSPSRYGRRVGENESMDESGSARPMIASGSREVNVSTHLS